MDLLGVTVDDLQPKPTDAKSTNESSEGIEKKQARTKLTGKITELWENMDVSEDDRKVFEGKLEDAGKLKEAGIALQIEERERLLKLENTTLLEEVDVTDEDLKLAPDENLSDTQIKNAALRKMKEEADFGDFGDY
ncbi:hypothetical protein TrVE_jg10779 [Triparma verrucosa]|uniref:Uncharacterized protein n=1 Tax=Triparma verrucosa TaxID=1606542 RepID=A0A9W7BV52_9STRA|nr:hypothetical protein TrVE_jg10779 [Triparma verrucosa]